MSKANKQKFTKYLFLLQLLKKNCRGNCDEKYKKIISYLDEDTLNFLAECIRNILNPQTISAVCSKKKQKILVSKVRPHKKIINSVIKKSLPFQKRKKYIQNGGAWFLPLISTVIPLISSLISSAVKRQ